jgi:putative component of membrane protein insertase Oxa1/YidC/SpoIIIJ protein YidD
MTAALALLAFYKRHVSSHTRPCPARLAGGRSCSTRMGDALVRHGLLAGVLIAAPQVWACCGNSHRSMPGTANNRYNATGRKNRGWN